MLLPCFYLVGVYFCRYPVFDLTHHLLLFDIRRWAWRGVLVYWSTLLSTVFF